MRLKVIIRVRPMSQREIHSGSQKVVAVEGDNNIAITNIKVPEQHAGDSRERIRRFAFDYCFSENATQDQIFETIESVIGGSLKNRNNSCVLAYGQTSSGKTHTMMGSPQNPGLTPRLCRRIFKYFEGGALKNETGNMKLTVSYLEIYNEKVGDLLSPEDNTKQGHNKHLKVREHPRKGPYVEGLSEHIVTNDDQLLERLESGTSKRKIGSTATNPKSSRSHSVISVCCDGVKLHLVDLAGNERAGSRGYGPNRFREGANINKSLVALGNVISTLADQSKTSSQSSKNKFVPYRDSVLTWLLKDTLQGSSRTVMIATISPSSTCYSESVNTLRFGQRAKLIVYRPVIVEDQKEKTIQELRAEIARLRDLLSLSHQISLNINLEDQMHADCRKQIKEPEESKPKPAPPPPQPQIRSSVPRTGSLPELSVEESHCSTSQAAPNQITTETLLPIMDVKSTISANNKKLKRTWNPMERRHSVDNAPSKLFDSQESLQSSKESPKETSGKSSVNNSRESLYGNLGSRRSSAGSSTVQIKQTALSLRRQAINKNPMPLLKTITQKKILGGALKKQEKGIVSEEATPKSATAKTSKKPALARQRSHIVAAVTSRLYGKVNRRDASTSTENLSSIQAAPKELKISPSARSKLADLTRRALKAHRRKNEETQTDMCPILRVKEVGTDCVGLEQATNEKKDVEVECALLNQFVDGGLKDILVWTRSCGVQTNEDKPANVSFKKYLTETKSSQPIITEAVNINISHNYINGNRTECLSDDSLDSSQRGNVLPTPDLISNHNSLEQHAKEPMLNEERLFFGTSNELENLDEKIDYIPTKGIREDRANVLTVPPYKIHCKMGVVSTQASEISLKQVDTERCKFMSNFHSPTTQAKVSNCPSQRHTASVYKPQVLKHTETKNTYSASEQSWSDENGFSDTIDFIENPMAANKKVQFVKRGKRSKNHLFKAMKEFLEEAKILMHNITLANHHSHCTQPSLDDFDIQVTVNDMSHLQDNSRKTNSRRESYRETSGTQTEGPSMETCFSQTSLSLLDYKIPSNRYESLLEDSCRRLEQKMAKSPRSRQVSVASEDIDDEMIYERMDRPPRYNPWDLSNVEVEDSSLESNPVTFSDYGSLPRKSHRKHRSSTCSPSAFLKQLTNMRRQIVEHSREELMQGCSKYDK
ncbi:hypothetical protein GWI33_006717 [Rhynchophorus ferrugineus]|uniref:Kinesin motor domain-containing protein n=1 Tax=Rhynchophorus ferrugineus TaxID=354439 RepID=A0A834MDI1_RHYFE|nr:hypothetical protein GWI33_006717 [Rhynchophorus ferrugineus]